MAKFGTPDGPGQEFGSQASPAGNNVAQSLIGQDANPQIAQQQTMLNQMLSGMGREGKDLMALNNKNFADLDQWDNPAQKPMSGVSQMGGILGLLF